MIDKIKMLEKTKENLKFNNVKGEFEKKLYKIQYFIHKNENEKFKFLEKELKEIRQLIEYKDNTNKIENEIKNLEKKIIQMKKSQEIDEIEENNLSQILTKKNPKSSKFAIILKTYSRLCAIKDEFKNINKNHIFLNRVAKFEKLRKLRILEAYNELLFEECENNAKVSENTIEIFSHLANSYIISNIVKNEFEEIFYNYINEIMMIKEDKINDIGSIFYDNEYIYFPKLKVEDIIYCFRYGNDDNYITGELNPTKIKNNIDLEENLGIDDCLRKIKEKILNQIKKNDKASKENINVIENNISKIKILFDKFKNMKFDINLEWLSKPINNLKNECLKNPNKLIIKEKFKYILDFGNNIFDGEKILAKALYASFEGNKKIYTIYQNSFIDNIIEKIQQLKQNFKYQYRIMGFYDFYLFEDYTSKTMMLIIKTINNILNKELKNYINHPEFMTIIFDILTNFIISIISSENPKFEDSKIIDIFKILLYSFFNRYKNVYNKIINNNNKSIEIKKQLFIKIISKIKKEAINKIDSEMNEYNEKLIEYKNDIENLEKSDSFQNSLEQYYRENYYFIKHLTFLQITKKSNRWKICRQNINKPIEELLNIQNKNNLYKINNIISYNRIYNNEYIVKDDY